MHACPYYLTHGPSWNNGHDLTKIPFKHQYDTSKWCDHLKCLSRLCQQPWDNDKLHGHLIPNYQMSNSQHCCIFNFFIYAANKHGINCKGYFECQMSGDATSSSNATSLEEPHE